MSYKENFYSECLILDSETTGKDYNTAEVIESGFVIREGNDWTMFNELHRPKSGVVPPAVESICYITTEMVADKPYFVDVKDTFQMVVDGFSEGYAVGHNYFYDMKVFQNHGITMPKKSICTWRMVKKLLNNIPELEETNLPYLRFALDLDVPLDQRCHRAGVDSYITAKLLEKLVEIMEELNLIDKNLPYGQQIEEWAKQPIIYTTMQFGKHKGENINDIPLSYFQWALKNMDTLNEDSDKFDPDFAATIAATLTHRGII